MFSKDDRNFFKPFPWRALAFLIVGLFLTFLPLEEPLRSFTPDFSLELGEFRIPIGVIVAGASHVVYWARVGTATVLLTLSVIRILGYLFVFTTKSTFEKNLAEVRQSIIEEVSKFGESLICDFSSFRPWMAPEFFVKSSKGEAKFFYPYYIVTVSSQGSQISVREYKVNAMSKSYELTGYRSFSQRSCTSAGLVEDRVLFSTEAGDFAATVDFLEFTLLGGSLRIPIFEREILSQAGGVKNLREETLSKVLLLTKIITKPKV